PRRDDSARPSSGVCNTATPSTPRAMLLSSPSSMPRAISLRSRSARAPCCGRGSLCTMLDVRRAGLALPRLSLGAVITVGTFDGVHVGHRDLLSRVTSRATARSLPSLLVTFEPHPLEVVNPSAPPPLLTTTDEKLEVIAANGL